MIIDLISLLIECVLILGALFLLLKISPSEAIKNHKMRMVYSGILLGAVGVFIMFMSFRMEPAAFVDARSIFLSLVALMFGMIPAFVMTAIMLVYRIILGGPGLGLGISVIMISSLVGLIGNRIFSFMKIRRKAADFLLLGLVVHLALLITILILSPGSSGTILNTVTAQILIIYPLLTTILGKLFEDHTLTIKSRESIHQADSKFKMIYDHAPIGIGYTTLDGEFVEVNEHCAKMLGYTKNEIRRLSFNEITHKEDLSSQMAYIAEIRAGDITEFNLDRRFLSSNGTVFWAHLSATKIRFSKDQPEYLMVVIQDINRKKESELFMEYIAYHDQLTDCHNGRYYEEFIERQNDMKDFPISLVRINVNGLKLINESVSHRAGDSLLQCVSRIIKLTCIESPVVARIGSNEFLVAFTNQTERQLRKSIAMLNHAFDMETIEGMKISVAIGYAKWDSPDSDYAEIYRLAESRMHSEEVVTKNSMYSKTIDIIINSLFEKNNREMLHSQRVSVICEKLARKMNFDQKSVEKIKIAGLMHDIGKIGISDEILNKEGRLTMEERNQIEKHSDAGYRILSSATEFSEIAESVLTHHERWDGKGYPKGLSGTNIPIFSRIIAVADSFDAMTSKRTYREAMMIDSVVDEMKINAGKQFDPNIVGLFLDNIEEFKEIA